MAPRFAVSELSFFPIANFSEISLFVSNFLKAVHLSKTIRTVFIVPTEAPNRRDLFYNHVLKSATNLGFTDPSGTAESIGDVLQELSDFITPPYFAYAIIAAIDHLLNDYRLLNTGNEVEMANSFVRLLDEELQSIEPLPESYLTAISNGTLKFLMPYNILTPESEAVLSTYFVDELRALKEKVSNANIN